MRLYRGPFLLDSPHSRAGSILQAGFHPQTGISPGGPSLRFAGFGRLVGDSNPDGFRFQDSSCRSRIAPLNPQIAALPPISPHTALTQVPPTSKTSSSSSSKTSDETFPTDLVDVWAAQEITTDEVVPLNVDDGFQFEMNTELQSETNSARHPQRPQILGLRKPLAAEHVPETGKRPPVTPDEEFDLDADDMQHILETDDEIPISAEEESEFDAGDMQPEAEEDVMPDAQADEVQFKAGFPARFETNTDSQVVFEAIPLSSFHIPHKSFDEDAANDQ